MDDEEFIENITKDQETQYIPGVLESLFEKLRMSRLQKKGKIE